jgi:hypothetical protein
VTLLMCHICNPLLTCIPVLSEPLPEDAPLFRKIDTSTGDIQGCYINMDKFWADEVQRATKALRNRRVDPEDIDRWRNFRGSLEHITADWEVFILPNIVRQGNGLTLKSTEKFHRQLEYSCNTSQYSASREAFILLSLCVFASN